MAAAQVIDEINALNAYEGEQVASFLRQHEDRPAVRHTDDSTFEEDSSGFYFDANNIQSDFDRNDNILL